ncbi:MAG: hypothetical protein ABIK28_25530 [Planctomycetota bacterium]
MSRNLLTACLVALSTLLLQVPYGNGRTSQTPDEKPLKYDVMMVTDMADSVSFVVIESDLADSFKKEKDVEFKAALEKWNDAKSEARKKKEEFSDPKPVQFQIKTLKKGLSKEEADAAKAEAEAKQKEEGSSSGGSSSDVKYAVIMQTGMNQEVDFKVIEAEKVKSFTLDLAKAYEAAVKSWNQAKKKAQVDKQKFETPKPMKPQVKVLKMGLSKEKADEALAKEQEKHSLKSATSEPQRKKKK